MRLHILKLIELQMDHYSPGESIVAQYVLTNPEAVLGMSTKQLATACHCSEAMIIRFCKKVGINSFKGLKMDLAKQLHAPDQNNVEVAPLHFEDSPVTTMEKVFKKSISALQMTSQLLDLSQLEEAASAIHQADRVFLYGASGSSVVALDTQYKLLRININAFHFPDIHVQMMTTANLTKRDVFFAISTSGKTREVVDLLKAAKNRGAKTILLTQQRPSPARKHADLILTISEEEPNIRLGTMSARIAQLAVLDTLFVRLCIQKGDAIFRPIMDTHEIVQHRKN